MAGKNNKSQWESPMFFFSVANQVEEWEVSILEPCTTWNPWISMLVPLTRPRKGGNR